MENPLRQFSPPIGDVPPGVQDYVGGSIKVTVSASKIVHKKMGGRTTVDSISKFVEREYSNIEVISVTRDPCGRYYAVTVREKEHAAG